MLFIRPLVLLAASCIILIPMFPLTSFHLTVLWIMAFTPFYPFLRIISFATLSKFTYFFFFRYCEMVPLISQIIMIKGKSSLDGVDCFWRCGRSSNRKESDGTVIRRWGQVKEKKRNHTRKCISPTGSKKLSHQLFTPPWFILIFQAFFFCSITIP